MLETELWATVSKEKFGEIKERLVSQFGSPEIKKRLTIEINNYEQGNIDTRIKITNGKPILVQKIGDWNARTRDEVEMDIPKDAQEILDLYKILCNLINYNRSFQSPLYFYTNYIWDLPEYEIKLFSQFGKSEAFGYEVELKNDSLDLDQVGADLDMKNDEVDKNAEFWINWNERVNLDAKTISEEKLLEYFSEYLSYTNN